MVAKKKLDLVHHILISKHIKLSEKEKQELFAYYHIHSMIELPRISQKDHAIQNMDVKQGDVIKIIRQSPTAGEAIFYREVADV